MMRRHSATSIKALHPHQTSVWFWLRRTSATSRPIHQSWFMIIITITHETFSGLFWQKYYCTLHHTCTFFFIVVIRSLLVWITDHLCSVYLCLQAHLCCRRTQASSASSQKKSGLQEPSEDAGCTQWHPSGLHRAEAQYCLPGDQEDPSGEE